MPAKICYSNGHERGYHPYSISPEDVTSQAVWQILKELIDRRWLAAHFLQNPYHNMYSHEIIDQEEEVRKHMRNNMPSHSTYPQFKSTN